MAVRTKVAESTECRQCCTFCDKVIYPRGCVEANCPYLYTYEDEKSGRQYMGCMQKIFKVEIDVELFRKAERTRHGFGAVKAVRTPLPVCEFGVERSYEGSGPAFECTNPRFFDAADVGPDGYRVFDLRDRIQS